MLDEVVAAVSGVLSDYVLVVKTEWCHAVRKT